MSNTIALVGARVITGDGSDPENLTVTMQDGRIVEVGGDPPSDATIVDVEGLTLLPGMIDLHTHMSGGDNAIGYGDEATPFKHGEPLVKAVLDSVEAARLTLQCGFTTVREIGTREYIDVFLRDAQATGQIVGPRIRAAGPGIAMTGGHGNFWDPARTADGVEAVIKRVRQLVEGRVDIIKVVSADGPETLGKWDTVQSTPEEIAAAFAEARRLGRRTAAHAMGGEAITNVANGGGDTVEHGWYLTEESCHAMKRAGTHLVPTLGNVLSIVRYGPALRMPWARMMADDEPAIFDRMRMAVELGVPFALGSDCGGNEACQHGTNAVELECYVRAGLTPMQAIESATSTPARVLGLDDQIGSIAVGKFADFVLVDGDPLEDVSIMGSGVRGVIQGGRVVRDDLGRLDDLRRGETVPPRTSTAVPIPGVTEPATATVA
jgi:imidazolonepropionase-like amidohydrolase